MSSATIAAIQRAASSGRPCTSSRATLTNVPNEIESPQALASNSSPNAADGAAHSCFKAISGSCQPRFFLTSHSSLRCRWRTAPGQLARRARACLLRTLEGGSNRLKSGALCCVSCGSVAQGLHELGLDGELALAVLLVPADLAIAGHLEVAALARGHRHDRALDLAADRSGQTGRNGFVVSDDAVVDVDLHGGDQGRTRCAGCQPFAFEARSGGCR